MQVQQIITREVFTCRAQDTLNRAAQLLWDHDCGCVPIVDDNSHVVGMLTDRDICMAAYTQGKPLYEIQVSTAMSKKVISCKLDDPVAAAENLLKTNKIRRLPVLDSDNRLAGLFSLNDLALQAFKDKNQKKKEVTQAEIADTLAAVCDPRIHKQEATAA